MKTLGLKIAVALGALVIMGGLGFWAYKYGLGTSPAAVPIVRPSQVGISSTKPTITAPSGKLIIMQKAGKSGLDFDVVYEGQEVVQNVQGIELTMEVSPATVTAGSSTIPTP